MRASGRRRPRSLTVGVGVALAAVVCAIALLASVSGAAQISASDALHVIGAHLSGTPSGMDARLDAIVWELRMPRILTAIVVGAGLALTGAVMQAVTRNALADPYLLGLSSGAAVGAVAVTLLGASVGGALFGITPAAFVGAMVALLLTLTLAGARGTLTPPRTVLAGVAVSAAASALVSVIVFWSATGDAFREILGWLMGTLAGTGWSDAALVAAVLGVVGIPVLASARTLDAFAFGDVAAASLGVHVQRARWTLLVATALLTGAMVATAGAIGFVGLVAPHVVRLLFGPGHRALLPLSALTGSAMLLVADTLARTAFDPRELPVGVVTALLGAPVFALLVARSRS